MRRNVDEIILLALVKKVEEKLTELQDASQLRGLRGHEGRPGRDGKDFNIEEHRESLKAWAKEFAIKFEDFTAEQIELLKGQDGKDGRNGKNGKDGKDFSLEENKKYLEALAQRFALKFDDLTDEQVLKLRGVKGDKGRDGKDFNWEESHEIVKKICQDIVSDCTDSLKLKFTDLTEEEISALRGPKGKDGRDGKDFIFEDHKEYFDSLKLKFSDLTPENIENLKLHFSHLTVEDVNSLKLKFTDLTEEEVATLRGPRGQRGRQGDKGEPGESIRGLPGPRGLPGATIHGRDGADGQDGEDAPYITDVKTEQTKNEIEFVFEFSDGTELRTNSIKLPGGNIYVAGGGGGGGGGSGTADFPAQDSGTIGKVLTSNGSAGTESWENGGGGSGTDEFAELVDLETAEVDKIDIKSNSTIDWTSQDTGAGTSAKNFSDPLTAGHQAEGATDALAYVKSIADETLNIGINESKGATDIISKDYSAAGPYDLDGNYTIHNIVSPPGTNIGVDHSKVKNFYIVINVSGVDITLERAVGSGSQWYGATTYVVKAYTSAIFVCSHGDAAYTAIHTVDKFAHLTDLTTAVVPAVNLTATTFFALTASLFFRQGAEFINDQYYGVGETVLDPLFSSHVFDVGVGAAVDVDGAVNGNLVFITTKGITGKSLNGINGTTFNLLPTFDLEADKAYILFSSYAFGSVNYSVFESGPSTGGGGGTIVDTDSYGSPAAISTAISVPTDLRARLFLAGSGGPVVDPVLDDGLASQELWLFGTSDTNTVELNNATNVKVNGSVVLKLGSMINFHWITGLDKWVEVSRNGIL